MTEMLDLATSFRINAWMYLLMSLTTWLVLRRPDVAAVRAWCWAGVLAGVSVWLISLRGAIDDVWSYAVAQPMLLASYLMYAQALRLEVERGWSWRSLAVVVLLYAGVMAYGFEHRQAWHLAVLVRAANSMVLLALTSAAVTLARQERSRNVYFIVVGFGLFTTSMLTNAMLTWLGHSALHALQLWVINHVMGVMSLLTLLMTSMGYLGLALERSERVNTGLRQAQWQAQQWREQARALTLLDRQRTLAVLANSLGHGLVQPLTATRLNAQLAARMAPSAQTPDQVQAVGALLSQAAEGLGRSTAQVEGIRSFLRPLPKQAATLTLQTVLSDAHDLLRQELMHRGIELSVQAPAQPVRVHAEVLPLTQALVQVMRNAINAVQGQPVRRITLTLSASERDACIEVLDSGPGLPAHLLGQSSQGAQLVQDWLGGLGLYMTHGILSQLGGRMALDNPESGGARVRLSLPLIHTPPASAS